MENFGIQLLMKMLLIENKHLEVVFGRLKKQAMCKISLLHPVENTSISNSD